MTNRTKVLAVLGLVAAIATPVAVHAATRSQDEPTSNAGYVCPLTGETLPCPNCCPLNKNR
jgi:hypothetical protein